MKGWMNACRNGQTNKKMDERTDRWMDEKMDG